MTTSNSLNTLQENQDFRLPLLSGQKALWHLHQFSHQNCSFSIGRVVYIPELFDKQLLNNTIFAIQNRHPQLRATFHFDGNEYYQLIHSNPLTQLVWIENAHNIDEVTEKMQEISAKPFNLQQGPLIRFNACILNENCTCILICAHNIILDYDSLRTITEDLRLFAFSSEPTSFPSSSLIDFIEDEQNYLNTQKAKTDLNYWQSKLENVPILELPIDYSRPKIRNLNGQSQCLELNSISRLKIFDITSQYHSEPSDLLFAIFIILLSRYSNQEDIVIGTSFNLRKSSQQNQSAGLFSNDIPFRVCLNNDFGFMDYVSYLNNQKKELDDHAAYPFSLLVDKLFPHRDISRHPVFQTYFDWYDEVVENPWKIIPVSQEDGQFDLACAVHDLQDSLKIYFRYSRSLFHPKSILSMLSRFDYLIQQIISDPTILIEKLSILKPSEYEELFHESETVSIHQMDNSCIVNNLIEEYVKVAPSETALLAGNVTLSYSELSRQSNKLATFLINKYGVSKGTRIGLFIDRSHFLIIGLLGILKSGGIYVPLDPSFPSDRIDYMIKDSNIELLLTISELKNNLNIYSNKIICLDNKSSDLNEASSEIPEINISPSDIAYIIYTSGSTGLPKGVEIYHGSLYNFINSMSKEPGLSKGDVFLAITTFSFDISLLELLGPICTGGTCVLLNREIASDASSLISAIDLFKPDIIQATPATWRMVIEAGWKKHKDHRIRILCGGEQLPIDLAKEILLQADELWNMYGPTETTIWSTCNRIYPDDTSISAGKAISNTTLYILDDTMQPLPWGIPGNLYIGGAGVARGYINKQDLTFEKFITDPFSRQVDERLYATGDLARFLCNGELEILGRVDSQIKLHGYRIEPGEIEAVLKSHPDISNAIVNLNITKSGDSVIAAYMTCSGPSPQIHNLREFCSKKLPSYMIPSAFSFLKEFPLTPNGKIDKKSLPLINQNENCNQYDKIFPRTEAEEKIASLWKELLSIEDVGIYDNFFDIGATSITASVAAAQLQRLFNRKDFSVLKIFSHPTVDSLARYFTNMDISSSPAISRPSTGNSNDEAVAIVGMAGCFPGAEDIEELWRNLCDGRETVSFFSPDELHASIPEELRNDPSYIGARGILDDIDKFDAAFFGIRPKEAQVMDPQQRIFLQTAWAALENAGYSPEKYNGLIGVYAGMGNNTYFTNNVLSHPDLISLVGDIILEIGTEKDHIAPRVSYSMDLHGPSLSIHTACSTTLVVVDHAFHALRSNQCDMAIAGGIDIHVPQKSGRLYQDGGIFTRDGHCRPFDANASGTMFGEGAGAVILKRLKDAIADNDTIYAKIIGSAVNHDGSRKVSYLAPSSAGQTEVILKALSVAKIHPETIEYIETHGTATPIGDPIEIEGLTNAFRQFTQKKQFCSIGSVKGNWGHATTAAGIVSLIKTALIMKNEKIPPSINYSQPNAHIDFENSPFFVNTTLKTWSSDSINPRRAAISSFGFCGTNAHVILEEAPKQSVSGSSRPIQLFLFSAKSQSSLSRYIQDMSAFLKKNMNTILPDAAYTLKVGRNNFPERAFYIGSDITELTDNFDNPDSEKHGSGKCNTSAPEVVFLFPGQGSQYINMGINLYKSEPLFRDFVDKCANILEPHLNRDIRDILYPKNISENSATESLKKTFFTQPAIFTIEYALANLWISWGVKPGAMIGHSIGEFVCACLADIFSLEDALMLVAARGKLMQNIMPGSMLSVLTSHDKLKKLLPDNLSIAAINGPNLCVVSGPENIVSDFEKLLTDNKIICRYLHSSHAFHSYMMDPAIAPFYDIVSTVNLNKPKIPIISTVTGNWMSDENALSPDYWAQHMRRTVMFSDAIETAWKDTSRVLLESGPRATSATLASQHITLPGKQFAIPSLSDKSDEDTEWTSILKAVGRLWLAGISIDWDSFYKYENRKRIPLPTYSFEKTSYWVEPANVNSISTHESVSDEKESGMNNQNQNDNKSVSIQLSENLRSKISEISGFSLSEASGDETFLSLGLDSLVLTQIARAVSQDYKVKISFSNLMDSISTLNSLTEYIMSEAKETVSNMFHENKQSDSSSTTPNNKNHENQLKTSDHRSSQGNMSESLLIRQMDIIDRLLHLLEAKEKSSKEHIKIIEGSDKSAPITASLPKADIFKNDNPPVPEAKLGRDENGYAAWYIPDPTNTGNFIKLEDNL